ncbi:MAG: hypothetical protein F6K03_13380, partial [Kamptonema sp. SIO4C4]|nr:hypothetical protein [Kamptonema sp. SIO4C4]
FRIEPTPESQQILLSYRLLVKAKVNGFVVLESLTEDGEPLVKLADDWSFEFILILKNTNFLDFTELNENGEKLSGDRVFYSFSNQGNTGEELNRKLVSTPVLNQRQYQEAFGIIHIENSASLQGEYKINFRAKKHYWYYYLITDSDTNGNSLLIEDSEAENIQFTQTELSALDSQKIGAIAASQFPEKQLYLFKSEQEIACQENGRKNIQLLKKGLNNGTTVWIEHLPNPPNRTGVQIINLMKSI